MENQRWMKNGAKYTKKIFLPILEENIYISKKFLKWEYNFSGVYQRSFVVSMCNLFRIQYFLDSRFC